MISQFRRKIRTVLRYFFPSAEDRSYLAAIEASGMFDRRYYLDSHPRLLWLFRIWPDRHYVQLGERNGVCPCPGFSPRAYLFHNPDLSDVSKPLLHYITTGQHEGRIVLAVPGTGSVPEMPRLSLGRAPKAEVAVALHLYYPELWESFAECLARQKFDFDLFVTLSERPDLPEGTLSALSKRIVSRFADAQVWILPNHGRDILPFVHLVNQGVLAPYKAVCKLHGKRSPHRADGDQWRAELINGVLGDPVKTHRRLRAFLADDTAGIWVADDHLQKGDNWWGLNRARAEFLLGRAGMPQLKDVLRFPAGSIYWARSEVIAKLAALRLDAQEFEPEQALVDGTTAHAVERLMGHLAQQAGRTLRAATSFDASPLDKTDRIG